MNRSRIRLASIVLLLAAAIAAAPAAEAQYARVSGFGKNKIQYRVFDWKIYHSPHFDVYYYPEEEHLLQKVVSFAESAYDRLSREFDFQIKEPTPLIFYATHSAFEQNNIILNFIPEGVGAFATPARNRMVLPVDLPDPELLELIAHELTHIFQYHILFQGKLGRAFIQSAAVVHRGHGELHGEGRVGARPHVPARRGGQRQHPVGGRARRPAASSPIASATRCSTSSRSGGGRRASATSSTSTATASARRSTAPWIAPSASKAEDFDIEFRRWLRRKYLPELVRTGEPSDFGKPFNAGADERRGQHISPAASPSGDLVASFSTARGDIDVVLFDTNRREVLRNLTKGFSTEYQYLVAQELALGRKMGRDLAFSPDGNRLALFAKRERGRSLVIGDVLRGTVERIVDMEVEQQMAPAWSADGRRIAFSANLGGQFDIFEYDLETGDVRNLTNDAVYDGSPAYSPDGKSLVLSAVVGGFAKIFRIDLGESRPAHRPHPRRVERRRRGLLAGRPAALLHVRPQRLRQHLRSGAGERRDPAVHQCRHRLLHAHRAPGARRGARAPGLYRLLEGRFDLYLLDTTEPMHLPDAVEVAEADPEQAPVSVEELPKFEPDITVTLDDANKDEYRGFKLFLEDVGAVVGVNSDQTFVTDTYLRFSDYLGDRRLIARFSSVESFSNFNIEYWNLEKRWQWGARLFDDRTYFVGPGRFDRGDLPRRFGVRADRAHRNSPLPVHFLSPVRVRRRLHAPGDRLPGLRRGARDRDQRAGRSAARGRLPVRRGGAGRGQHGVLGPRVRCRAAAGGCPAATLPISTRTSWRSTAPSRAAP